MGFYLGNEIVEDAAAPEAPVRVEYDPKDLTTHGLIFGMTGSGKTGLAVGLMEEAQRARIPIIAIDPKGDLTNLALAWPDLSPKHFASWIDPARLEGKSPLDVAEATAGRWREGLAKDGLGEADIAAMRRGAHLTVYTPGSTAGIPVSLLDRFAPPPGYAALPEEDKSELVGGLVGALLALVKIDADPLQSKEYILLANILAKSWDQGVALDLPRLVKQVAEPPFSKLGVFELDDFFPDRKRKALAMQLNGLIASPSFQAWLTGVPLDVDQLLARESGAPARTSIFSIAHLDDAERMSFVALLLDRVIAWMRAQPGTGELRALIYMDEVFGYLPPHPSNPPTKRAILTLLKQARAFGLGVLLATQNPVDVDYKALTNAGTWMIGKLQTDQDKERILDGLMGAQTADVPVSRADVSRRISALEGRQFLLQNAHEPGQRVFKTRYCMSYLRGPLTRQEIGRLREVGFYNDPETRSLDPRPPARAADKTPAPAAAAAPKEEPVVVGEVVEPSPHPSPVAKEVMVSTVFGLPTRHLPSPLLLRAELRSALGIGEIFANGPLTLRPALIGEAQLTFSVDDWGELSTGTVTRVAYPLPATPGAVSWRVLDGRLEVSQLVEVAPAEGVPTALPAWLHSPADRDRARDLFVRDIIGKQTVTIPVCPPLRHYGSPNEPLEDFRRRLGRLLGQAADGALGKAETQEQHQAAIFDKQIDEMKRLIEMDKNELKYHRERGDDDAYGKAVLGARLRIESYKELRATRDKFAKLAARGKADIEFAAIDKLAACELRQLTLDPKGVRMGLFGLLWIPSR